MALTSSGVRSQKAITSSREIMDPSRPVDSEASPLITDQLLLLMHSCAHFASMLHVLRTYRASANLTNRPGSARSQAKTLPPGPALRFRRCDGRSQGQDKGKPSALTQSRRL